MMKIFMEFQPLNCLLLSCGGCLGKCSDSCSGCGLLVMNECVNLRKQCVCVEEIKNTGYSL